MHGADRGCLNNVSLTSPLQPGGGPSNKTGTLNTKSVTASMLATDSPVLPHKVNGSHPQQQVGPTPASWLIPLL